MKISYKQMPFLAAIESGTLLDKEHPIKNYADDDYNPSLIKAWLMLNKAMETAYKDIAKNVVLVSSTYMDALYRSSKAFDNLIEKGARTITEETFEGSGCYIFPDAQQKDIRLAVIYHNSPDVRFVFGIIDNDTIAYANIDTPAGQHKFITRRFIANGGQEWVEKIFLRYLVYLRMMEKYAKVETKVIASGAKVRLNPRYLETTTNTSKLNVKYRDSRWFTEIVRNEGFMVSGHFRLQPKKVNGEWTRELIYINEFQKHGYHRRAQIETEEV